MQNTIVEFIRPPDGTMEQRSWISSSSFNQPIITPPTAWWGHAPFAFWLIEKHRPNSLVELGTNAGYSYFCFCQQIKALGLATRCVAVDTWEGDEHTGLYDNRVFEFVNDHNSQNYSAFSRLIRSTFDKARDEIPDKSVDLLHIDGCHLYEQVKHDFESWKNKLSSRSIVLLHDTQVKERNFGVWKLWQEISLIYPSFEFTHWHGLGLICLGDSKEVRELPIFSGLLTKEEQERIRSCYEILGHHVAISQPIRRNESCPCGSGEKYKHCHGKLV